MRCREVFISPRRSLSRRYFFANCHRITPTSVQFKIDKRIIKLEISFGKETQGSGHNFGRFDGICLSIAKPFLSDFKMHRFGLKKRSLMMA